MTVRLIKSVYRPPVYRAPPGAGVFFFGPLLGCLCWIIILGAVALLCW
jgi:hypothetical protein